MSPQLNLLRVLAYASVYLGWGTTYLAIRVGVREMTPAAFLGLRFLLAAGAVAFFLIVQSVETRKKLNGLKLRQVIHASLQGLFLLVGGLLPMAYSERSLSSSETAIIIGCAPIGFAIFDRILNGTRIRISTVVAVVFGISGILMLNLRVESGTHAMNAHGLLEVILGCALWCFGSVASRKLRPSASPLFNVLVQYITSGLTLMSIGYFFEGFSFSELHEVRRSVLTSLFYIALGPSLISYTSYVWLLRIEPSSRISTYAFVNPVVAVFAGALILGEQLSFSVISALIFVLVGTALQFELIRIPERKPISSS